MRVLIVEDEWESREGLTNALHTIDLAMQIQVADDAEQGFLLLDAQLPDLIFLDIRMPGMDGLDMLERIRKRYGDLCVVILSAYDHFPYAQRAIRLGVFDYIVKPYSMDSVRAIVEHAASGGHDRSATGAAQGVYMLSALSRWLRDPANYARSLAEQLKLPLETPGRLVLLRPMLDTPEQRRFYQHASPSLVRDLRNVIEERYAPEGQSLTFLSGSEIVSVLLQVQNDLSGQELSVFLREYLQETALRTGVTLSATVSGSTPSILQNPLRCYHQAQTLSEFAFYTKPFSILTPEAIVIDTIRTIEGSRVERVHAAVREGNPGCAASEAGALIDEMARAPWMPPQRMIFTLHTGLTELLGKLSGSMPTSAHKAFDERLHEISEYASHISAFKAQFIAICRDIADVVQAFQLNKSVSIISHCIDHLAGNYGDNGLTQESVAQMFHFSPSYFGSLFKTTTGQTFVQYLNNLRIQKAQEMLKASSLKVYDIAERTGFADVRYFIRVFKKTTGLSPNQYRQITAPGKGSD
jgi:two-component system response regulator YesN